jgi:recombination protein RecR
MNDLPSLQQLLKQLQQVPYLASKNIYRVATHFLAMDPAKLEQFCKALQHAQENTVRCELCNTWVEKGAACVYCQSSRRTQTLVCVVETWQELMVIERSGGYQGVYHVLGGVISPLDGVGPEDLTIAQLVARVAEHKIEEVILATAQTPEGEATAAYIARQLKPLPVKVSCLARGMPVGSTLEFMDRLTVYKAMAERRPF